MSDLVSYVNSDIMGDLCFGRNWNVLERTENRDLLEAFKNGSGAVNIVSH